LERGSNSRSSGMNRVPSRSKVPFLVSRPVQLPD
jgi:hypothetical protein